MSTDAPAPPPTVTEPPRAEAERSNEERREWSSYVNIGDGAADCEARLDGSCTDPAHFHAWCHLPNPFQVRDIVMKSRAAMARHRQLLRDESSDARVVLEEELWSLRDAAQEILAEEILDKDFAEDYTAAEKAVREMLDEEAVVEEGEDLPRLYEHIEQDREEYERQVMLPDEQRDEHYELLERRVADYGERIEEEMKARREPRRQALLADDKENLIEVIRRDRIDRAATEAYLHTHATWTWYICTLKPVLKGRPKERIWESVNQMRQEADPDVVVALRRTFDRLDSQMGRSSQGNS